MAVEEGTVDHYLLLLGLQKAGLQPDDVELQPLPTDAAAAAFAAGQLDAVGVFAPFTDHRPRARGLEGAVHARPTSRAPSPTTWWWHASFVEERPDDVQKLVDAWYETLDCIEANPDEADRDHGQAGRRDRRATTRTYDAGTTIFTVADNLEAFTPGTDMKHLDFAATPDRRRSCSTPGSSTTAPDLTGLLDATFVQARAAKPA